MTFEGEAVIRVRYVKVPIVVCFHLRPADRQAAGLEDHLLSTNVLEDHLLSMSQNLLMNPISQK